MTLRSWFRRWLLGSSAFSTVDNLPLYGAGDRFKKPVQTSTVDEAAPPAAWDTNEVYDTDDPAMIEPREPMTMLKMNDLSPADIPAPESLTVELEEPTVADAAVTENDPGFGASKRKRELTPEQRERKNARDRARRAEQKAKRQGAELAA